MPSEKSLKCSQKTIKKQGGIQHLTFQLMLVLKPDFFLILLDFGSHFGSLGGGVHEVTFWSFFWSWGSRCPRTLPRASQSLPKPPQGMLFSDLGYHF